MRLPAPFGMRPFCATDLFLVATIHPLPLPSRTRPCRAGVGLAHSGSVHRRPRPARAFFSTTALFGATSRARSRCTLPSSVVRYAPAMVAWGFAAALPDFRRRILAEFRRVLGPRPPARRANRRAPEPFPISRAVSERRSRPPADASRASIAWSKGATTCGRVIAAGRGMVS